VPQAHAVRLAWCVHLGGAPTKAARRPRLPHLPLTMCRRRMQSGSHGACTYTRLINFSRIPGYRVPMKPVTATPAHLAHTRVFPRLLFALNAAVAWIGVSIGLVSNVLHQFDYPETPHLFNSNGALLSRLVDHFSYFTVLSTVVVAVAMTILAIAPNRGRIFWVFRLDSVLMLSVTALLYWYMLAASYNPQGLDRISNLFDHTLTPIVTVVVWLLVGPRNWIRWWTVAAAMIFPVVWAAYTLIHGSLVDAYPYEFISVPKYGMPAVLTTIGFSVVFGIVLLLIYWGLDVVLSGRARASQRAVAEDPTQK